MTGQLVAEAHKDASAVSVLAKIVAVSLHAHACSSVFHC